MEIFPHRRVRENHFCLGQNFFIFVQVSGKIGLIVCWCTLRGRHSLGQWSHATELCTSFGESRLCCPSRRHDKGTYCQHFQKNNNNNNNKKKKSTQKTRRFCQNSNKSLPHSVVDPGFSRRHTTISKEGGTNLLFNQVFPKTCMKMKTQRGVPLRSTTESEYIDFCQVTFTTTNNNNSGDKPSNLSNFL